jgi:hypothetical protein
MRNDFALSLLKSYFITKRLKIANHLTVISTFFLQIDNSFDTIDSLLAIESINRIT